MPVRTRSALILSTLAAAAALVTACGARVASPYTFPAAYSFMGSPGAYKRAPDCAAYGTLTVADDRTDKSKVGVRHAEDDHEKFAVSMSGDAMAWLRSAVVAALEQAGIAQSGARTLDVRLKSIATDESVYMRAEYDGTVIIEAQVGEFTARKKGFAENYGYQGSDQNYQETVNHALDKALAQLVNDPGFTRALCD